MTMATAGIGIALTALAGCGSDAVSDDVTSPTTSTPTPAITSEAPSVDPTTDGAVAVRGDWEIPAEDYVLHLIEDGTFVQDYMGIEDFRTGKYSVEGDTISLVGDDGDTDEGTIKGDTLVFTLGTATRVK
ncbi:hypothetical protein [Aeromicrobium stalagmiti]|uniref:hypothetical protein n=1 Tax=Aeromicrobium stalagmiti TaxID=2738988 RepID=UPI0015681E6F|nr:hypothetical protein [Aeromicrobium stalagmiti]NRQ50090.1 hypothetical protein [Aeromicrobium stalagmiti]